MGGKDSYTSLYYSCCNFFMTLYKAVYVSERRNLGHLGLDPLQLHEVAAFSFYYESNSKLKCPLQVTSIWAKHSHLSKTSAGFPRHKKSLKVRPDTFLRGFKTSVVTVEILLFGDLLVKKRKCSVKPYGIAFNRLWPKSPPVACSAANWAMVLH